MQHLPPNAARRSFEEFELVLFTPFPFPHPPPDSEELMDFATGKEIENRCVSTQEQIQAEVELGTAILENLCNDDASPH